VSLVQVSSVLPSAQLLALAWQLVQELLARESPVQVSLAQVSLAQVSSVPPSAQLLALVWQLVLELLVQVSLAQESLVQELLAQVSLVQVLLLWALAWLR